MIWALYNVLFAVGFLLVLPRFLLRMARRGGYSRHFWERVGIYERNKRNDLSRGGRIWIHAVSVGEVLVALRFMDELRRRHSQLRFVLSTTTSTGHAVAERRLVEEDILIYFPVDFPPVVRRVLRLMAPRLLILVECELWPNLVRTAHARGVPVVLVNGRISEHSYRGYRRLRVFTRRLLPIVEVMCVQSSADREKLLQLGGVPQRVRVVGSAKYDLADVRPGSVEEVDTVLERCGMGRGRKILLGGSTWAGEEEILLRVYKEARKRFPDLRLILAPRHVERMGEVIRAVKAAGMTYTLRSSVDGSASGGPVKETDVLLIDTTGELRLFYHGATVIFIGKSLTRHGGQNIVEPAAAGRPVIVGPNLENFPVVFDDFKKAGAITVVRDEIELGKAVEELLADPERCRTLGERASRLVREKGGAVARTADMIERYLVD